MSVSRETGNAALKPMTKEDFLQIVPVSRETMLRLEVYADALIKWQASINLVGSATLPDLWRRHFLDSAQIFPYLPDGPVIDLGSGAGFPGLVLAILRREKSGSPIHLIESDIRKCSFLREIARMTESSVVIHSARIEKVPVIDAAAITARALASLEKLLHMAEPFLQEKTELFFLKGGKGEEELTETAKEWRMTVDKIQSLSDSSGVIYHLRGVSRGRKKTRG